MRVLRDRFRLAASVCGMTLFVLLTLVSTVSMERLAYAEAPSARAVPVHVLALDSDDSEDQADALTGAIRSRVRMAPGWSLQETQHALGMLTAALRCPQRPDVACQQRIGDQLRTDHFIWGVVAKSAGNQVTAEVHLWSRGKPDTQTKETYSNNLKDQNDETLRRVAARILDRITGSVTTGTIAVHAGDAEGSVWINGTRKQSLEHGAATIELPAGTYAVEVRSNGFAPAAQEGVVVTAGQETSVALRLVSEPIGESGPITGGGPTAVRRAVAWTLIGVGVAAEIVTGVEGARFLSLRGDLNTDRGNIDKSVTDVCAPSTNATQVDACSKFNDAKSARTVAALVGSAGAVAIAAGVILLVTDHSQEGFETSTTTQGRLLVLPYVSPRPSDGAGVNMSLTF
jgi:hypothetical protein